MKRTFSLPPAAGWLACGLALAMTTCGCSTFRRDWNKATAAPPPANDISGPWEGSWLSEGTGHHGKLRCLVNRLDHGRYRARYKATYWKIFQFSYTVDMQVQPPSNDTFKFQGATDLGWWGGGVYHYDGQATPTNFFSAYKSKSDHGTFRMRRPER